MGSFIAFGYFLFNASKRAEQNQVWAGMAKETAHQLGTPISAILGWVEYLKEVFKDKPEQDFIIHELKKMSIAWNSSQTGFLKSGQNLFSKGMTFFKNW